MNLADINDAWNRRIKYLAEPEGQDDWQLPSETITLGTGDCEDLAIGKFFSIKWFTEREPELMVCRLRDGELDTAHVVVIVDGWVLDNAAPEIVKLSARPDITPVSRSWQHEIHDPRFAHVIVRMDPIGELIKVHEWLHPGT